MFEKVIVKPRLSTILKERGIDSVELELLTGVSLAVIHRFDRSVGFDIRDLIKISRALDMTVEEMFDIHTEEEVNAYCTIPTRDEKTDVLKCLNTRE